VAKVLDVGPWRDSLKKIGGWKRARGGTLASAAVQVQLERYIILQKGIKARIPASERPPVAAFNGRQATINLSSASGEGTNEKSIYNFNATVTRNHVPHLD
jgi:hypothetical protein